MARVPLTPQIPKGPHPGAVGAGALDLAWTAADTVNKQQVAASGRDLLLMWNTDVAAHTVTLSSVADKQNRTGDVTNYSIAAGTISAYKFDDLTGWSQADGSLYFEANHAGIKFAVVKM